MTKMGSWPYVDIVVVKDYEQKKESQGKPNCFVRIHMDIEITEADSVEVDRLLKDADHKRLFDKLVSRPAKPDPRGLATLKAALGV